MEEFILINKGPYADVYASETTYIKIYNKLEGGELNKMYDYTTKIAHRVPHLVPGILSITKDSNSLTILMEKVEGITLKKFIEEKHTPEEIVKLVASFINTVLSFHDAGYIHGDLHERNIIVKEDLSIILLDFDTVDEYSKENLYESGDCDYLKFYIAVLIFRLDAKDWSIDGIMKLTKNMKVEDVFCHEYNPNVADLLYKMFKIFNWSSC